MSWLFGIKNQTPPQAAGGEDDPNKPAPAPLTNSERKAMEAYRFDSSALERAAEAAKTLERSSEYTILLEFLKGNNLNWTISFINSNLEHAREALELSKLQESTKQQEVCINNA